VVYGHARVPTPSLHCCGAEDHDADGGDEDDDDAQLVELENDPELAAYLTVSRGQGSLLWLSRLEHHSWTAP
jgi:hypothetical protein